MTFLIHRHCLRFRAGIETDITTGTTLSDIMSVMVAFGIKFFVKFQDILRAGSDAQSASFTNFRLNNGKVILQDMFTHNKASSDFLFPLLL
jgi:hypothetical protein